MRGNYYAHSTLWPEVVFMISGDRVRSLLEGPAHFAKERFTGN